MFDAAPLRAAAEVDTSAPAALGGAESPVVARVEAYRDAAKALDAWQTLEDDAPISPYQTRAWLLPWMETTGASSDVSPFLIVAYDPRNRPLALLPLGVWRQGVLAVAGFLGGRDSNFNLGLFRPGPVWNRAAILALLRAGAAALGTRVDLFVFRNQPHAWDGEPNPLALLPGQPSPSFGYKVALARHPEDHFKRSLSRDTRRKLRQKIAHLNAYGPTEHRIARSPAEAQAVLDAFVEQRIKRSAALGLSASDLPGQRLFLERASALGVPEPAVELHALHCGDRIVATFAGATHRGRFCGMVMSFDSGTDVLRMSPGEILLAKVIEAKCREGITVFDLGIGEARYKSTYTPDPEPLFDSLVAVSNRGRLFAAVERLRLQTKRSIKQSAWAWSVVRALRRVRRALSRSVSDQAGGRQI